MSTNWRSSKPKAIEAHPLMAAEITRHRTTMKLECEIKRLRSEVGLMAKPYHGARQEVNDMVTRLRAQPQPPVPQRGPPRQVEEGSEGGDIHEEKERVEEDTTMGEDTENATEPETESEPTVKATPPMTTEYEFINEDPLNFIDAKIAQP
ncbi:hypothetical protein Q9L58_004660 [Maublancomyces gigas]|uniref:Uncharacterized protein n=1 Tax=Discina gigas TaxID=1032678 RepID=A0ABR3GKE5_9PEZI